LYDVNCPVAWTAHVIGDSWTALILREFFRAQPRRFRDIEAALGGIAPNVLSTRLKWLEEHGVIESRLYSAHPPRAEYSLTDKGRKLGPILKSMKDWGERYRPD
jgi:DNA-binding HxlR family transcriptional regulator